MSRSQWTIDAAETATAVYARLIDDVVKAHVLKDRAGGPLSERDLKRVHAGTAVDRRPIRLMTISGKGGHSDDPDRRAVYERFFNVSLLDHLLSVTRGALVLAALNELGQNPEMDRDRLRRRLDILAVVAFLHDLDKDAGLARNTEISTELVADRMERYGIGAFLDAAGITLTPDQIRYLIEKVEATQSHRHPPDPLPPRDLEPLPLYVRLADRLDGTWLSGDPETGGLAGVMEILATDESCLRTDILRHWRPVQIYDPHHPFLLDELQRWLSLTSLEQTGISPLIEVHQDGHLIMLLPAHAADAIIDGGVDRLCRHLPFRLQLDVSNRGIPSLYNGAPDHDRLADFIADLPSRTLGELLKIKRELLDDLLDPLDQLLGPIDLAPRPPANPTSALVTLFTPPTGGDPENRELLCRAAHLALLLNLKLDSKPKDGIPDGHQREAELLTAVGDPPPDWIAGVADDASRRTLTALWATARADADPEVEERVWTGEESLLRRWLTGDGERPGFNQFIQGRGPAVIRGVRKRLTQILTGRRVTVEDESAAGRCLFTDEPVSFQQTIDQALGLYGVKVSAFSGREGRPETVQSERAHTNVGFASIAEHRLRTEIHAEQGGRESGVPTLISSPSTSGLFGGLGLTDDQRMPAMSLYDLNRYEIKKGRVLHGDEIYRHRFRMARLERVPESLADQVATLRMLLNAAIRMGRPIHVFRGLPVLRRDYFYYDAMPGVLADLIGGRALRLEAIPRAIERLGRVEEILAVHGLTLDLVKLYAAPRTRLGAICLAWCHLRDRDDAHPHLSNTLKTEFITHKEETAIMSPQDGALVRLGRAAARIQRRPAATAAAGEELLVFKICLDTANELRRIGQTDPASIAHGIAGELETNLVRKGKASAKSHRDDQRLIDGCMALAEQFVNEVWIGVLGGKSPSQKTRRILSSIYRMAFLTAAPKAAAPSDPETEPTDPQ